MATAALKKVGVELVVESLADFSSKIDRANDKIQSLADSGNFVGKALDGLRDAFGWLGDKIIDVATYAIGQLLADAIEWLITKVRELVTATIEAGSQFQIMELRLNRLNFNDKSKEIKDYDDAMAAATAETKEQLEWIQKLAVTTPYDAQDVANVYTLARSYGFASGEAQNLTRDITDFASGMGLGNVEIERIIVNFGQMVQQGKVTQREMNDLARGAFVPVNDVLKIMQERTGLAGKEFDAFRNSTEGVNMFMAAFAELVKTRFQGAAQDMARTFVGATANAQDFIKSLFGFNVVTPILERLGGGLADMLNSLTEGGKWEVLNNLAAKLGEALSGVLEIFQEVFFGGFTGDDFAYGLMKGMMAITEWINNNEGKIRDFFTGVRDTIVEKVIPFFTQKLPEAFGKVKDWFAENKDKIGAFWDKLLLNAQRLSAWVEKNVVKAFNQLSAWVEKNKPLIDKFFTSLGEIFTGVIWDLTHVEVEGGGLQALLDGIAKFMQYIIDNKQEITKFIEQLLVAWAVMQVGVAIIAGVGAVLAALAGVFIVAAVSSLINLVDMFTFLGKSTLEWTLNTTQAFIDLTKSFAEWSAETINKVNEWAATTRTKIEEWWTKTVSKFTEWVNTTKTKIKTWAADIWNEIRNWASNTWNEISNWASNTWNEISNWASNTWNTISDWANDVIATLADWVTRASQSFLDFAQAFQDGVGSLLQTAADTVTEMVNIFLETDWWGVGADIIGAITDGVLSAANFLIDTVISIVDDALSGVMTLLELLGYDVPGGPPTPPPPGTCFAGDTLVMTIHGNKPIQEIEIGEQVFSYDLEAGQVIPTTVTGTIRHEPAEVGLYLLINGHLRVTGEHELWTGARWQMAQEFRRGDTLFDGVTRITVSSIRVLPEKEAVYNIHVDHGCHNYFAGGVLVHNAQTDPKARASGRMQNSLAIAMEDAIMRATEQVLSPAYVASGRSLSTYSNITNNYTLNLSSRANTSSVMQDFNMLRSLAGV